MLKFSIFNSTFIGFIVIIWSAAATGQLESISREAAAGKTVADITVQGIRRTQVSVVYQELLFRKNQPLDLKKLDTSIVRLKNLRLFSQVDVSLFVDEKSYVYVLIDLQEVWTTIPILKITRGGDTTYFVAGLYDINATGRYLELGGQYESWNNEPGGVVWFREPRFMNKRLRFGGDVWSVKRPHKILEPDGTHLGDFVLYRRRLNLFMDSEFNERFTAGVGIEANKDRYLAVDMTLPFNDDLAAQLEDDDDKFSVLARAYIKLGRIDHDSYLLSGAKSELMVEKTLSDLDSDDKYFRAMWDNRVFWRLFSKTNLSARLLFSVTDSNELRHMYYLGGFENVRGYLDGQLRGKRFWQTNIEYRSEVYKWRWFVLQSNVFFDSAQLYKPSGGAESDNDDIFYSVGVGLRLISPNIYRFIGRLDIAVDTSHPDTSRISFGVQQFF